MRRYEDEKIWKCENLKMRKEKKFQNSWKRQSETLFQQAPSEQKFWKLVRNLLKGGQEPFFHFSDTFRRRIFLQACSYFSLCKIVLSPVMFRFFHISFIIFQTDEILLEKTPKLEKHKILSFFARKLKKTPKKKLENPFDFKKNSKILSTLGKFNK